MTEESIANVNTAKTSSLGDISDATTQAINALDNAIGEVPLEDADDLRYTIAENATSPTTKAYAVGEYFYYGLTDDNKSDLCRVTKAIASGDTIYKTGANKNCESVTKGIANVVNEEVADLKTNIVLIQSAQPTSEENRIWIPTEQSEEVEVPTYEEFADVKSAIINNVLDFVDTIRTADGDAYQYVSFGIVKGHTYKIRNLSTATINVHSFTQASSSGETVETMATSKAPSSEATFTATANAAAVRVYYYQGYGTVEIVDMSAKINEVYAVLPTKVDKTGAGQIDEKNTTFFTESPNLIDLNSVVDGYRLNQTGTDVYEDEGRSTTGYIDVRDINSVTYCYFPSGVKTLTTFYFVLYDGSKTPLANRSTTAEALDVSNAAYIRISFTTAQKETAMLYDTSLTVSEYKKYGYVFKYDVSNIVEVKPSDDIIALLLANAGKTLKFTDGTYDIIAIYKAKFGNDYFDNYTGYSSGGNNIGRGLPVLRGTNIVCTEGAVFTAVYSGENSSVTANFSAFALESDVTIDGLNITTSGIRNAIHDDFDNNYSGRTIIKNCKLVSDSKVIAGGLALHDYVEISNCYIKNTTQNVTADFSYHNNVNSGAQSKIIIKDNYCEHGISLRYYGTSTAMTEALVSNNSVVNDIEYIPENSSALVSNIDIKKWNNEIRQ